MWRQCLYRQHSTSDIKLLRPYHERFLSTIPSLNFLNDVLHVCIVRGTEHKPRHCCRDVMWINVWNMFTYTWISAGREALNSIYARMYARTGLLIIIYRDYYPLQFNRNPVSHWEQYANNLWTCIDRIFSKTVQT